MNYIKAIGLAGAATGLYLAGRTAYSAYLDKKLEGFGLRPSPYDSLNDKGQMLRLIKQRLAEENAGTMQPAGV